MTESETEIRKGYDADGCRIGNKYGVDYGMKAKTLELRINMNLMVYLRL
jgi:hypothetical protein